MLIVSISLRALLISCLLPSWHCLLPEDDASGEDGKGTKDKDAEEDGKTKEEPEREFTDTELREAHADFDENKNGKISHEEVMDFVEKHHKEVVLEDFDPADEMTRKDTSGNGFVDLEEHLKDTTGHIADDIAAAKAKVLETDRFNAADSNGDGQLSTEELTALIAPETAEKMLEVNLKHAMQETDENKDGVLNLEEFKAGDFVDESAAEMQVSDEDVAKKLNVDVASITDMEGEKEDIAAQKLFTRLDANGDGTLDKDELRPWASGRIGREDVANSFIESLDKDGDKQIDPDELIQGKSTLDDSEIQDYLIAWAKHRQIIPR